MQHNTAANMAINDSAVDRTSTSVPVTAGQSPANQTLSKLFTPAIKQALDEFSQKHPGYFKLFDGIAAASRSLGKLPEWCYADTDASDGAYAVYHKKGATDEASWNAKREYRSHAVLPAFLARWRLTKGVYRFDPDLYDELVRSTVDADFPMDILARIPEWAVYIETPTLTFSYDGSAIEGVGIHLEIDKQYKPLPVINLFLLTPEGKRSHEVLPYYGFDPKAEPDIDALFEGDQYRKDARRLLEVQKSLIGPVLSLAAWLCSEAPEIGNGDVPAGARKSKLSRNADRYLPAKECRQWDVGVRIGEAIRKAKKIDSGSTSSEDGQRLRYACHIRKAHWHRYRHGPGRAEIRLRWLSPILINAKEPEALPVTIYPVATDTDSTGVAV